MDFYGFDNVIGEPSKEDKYAARIALRALNARLDVKFGKLFNQVNQVTIQETYNSNGSVILNVLEYYQGSKKSVLLNRYEDSIANATMDELRDRIAAIKANYSGVVFN